MPESGCHFHVYFLMCMIYICRITVAEGGIRELGRGWAPTLFGYSFQGLGKFGFYEIFKVLYNNLLGEVNHSVCKGNVLFFKKNTIRCLCTEAFKRSPFGLVVLHHNLYTAWFSYICGYVYFNITIGAVKIYEILIITSLNTLCKS